MFRTKYFLLALLLLTTFAIHAQIDIEELQRITPQNIQNLIPLYEVDSICGGFSPTGQYVVHFTNPGLTFNDIYTNDVIITSTDTIPHYGFSPNGDYVYLSDSRDVSLYNVDGDKVFEKKSNFEFSENGRFVYVPDEGFTT